ncbi:glucosaminidase domain-containing protein [Amycolatopsis sp. RTGN1]|uniref:glucosaminidase domain-containing protein n=1 Tax=Amycolatopsis ponsaeliensis TaxID=2992142 RepID=UPI002551A9FA|nr:glucosaminidase domain-containing protein [Amycolatopsis sp. RTGN1]
MTRTHARRRLFTVAVTLFAAQFAGGIAQAAPPPDAPAVIADAARDGETAPVAIAAGSQEDFINAAGPAAQRGQAEYGVPASVTVAQAIQESAWGTAAPNNNHFGIKCSGGVPGPIATGCARLKTFECNPDGTCYETYADFRMYASMEDSFRDHGRFLRENTRYANAFNYTGDPDQFIREVHRAGYATDVNYSNTIINLMVTYNLYRFNTVANPALAPTPGAQGTYNGLTASVEMFTRDTDGLLAHTYLSPDGRSGAWSTHGDWHIVGKPVTVYNPNSGAVEVYARDTKDLLIHTYIGRDGQYGPWDVIGDWHITTPPAATYNPRSRAVEIYGRDVSGLLIHTYLGSDLKHGPWSVVGDRHFEGTPSAVYNPVSDAVDVYARETTSGLLIHTYLGNDGQHGPWSAVGDRHLTDDPTAVFNDQRRSVEVYARETTGLLVHTYLGSDLQHGPWSAVGDWHVTGTPAAAYNPSSGAVEVYGRDVNGLLIHNYLDRDGRTGTWSVIGDWHITGTPTAVLHQSRRSIEVYARDTLGLLIHTYLGPDLQHGPWSVIDADHHITD